MTTGIIFGLGAISAIVLMIIITMGVVLLKLRKKVKTINEEIKSIQSNLLSMSEKSFQLLRECVDELHSHCDSVERDCKSYADSKTNKKQVDNDQKI